MVGVTGSSPASRTILQSQAFWLGIFSFYPPLNLNESFLNKLHKQMKIICIDQRKRFRYTCASFIIYRDNDYEF